MSSECICAVSNFHLSCHQNAISKTLHFTEDIIFSTIFYLDKRNETLSLSVYPIKANNVLKLVLTYLKNLSLNRKETFLLIFWVIGHNFFNM